jgi:hypothetical protein
LGPDKFEIPEHFTIEFLLAENAKGKTDQMIADDLLISRALLMKWKKEIGWIAHSGKNLAGRKPTIDVGQLVELRKQGLKRKDIASLLDVSVRNVDHHLDRLGLSKKRKRA